MIWIVLAAHQSQMYTRPANIRSGLATSFATSESLRRQKEQRIVLRSMHTSDPNLKFPQVHSRAYYDARHGDGQTTTRSTATGDRGQSQTTERYLGWKQKLRYAVNDTLRL